MADGGSNGWCGDGGRDCGKKAAESEDDDLSELLDAWKRGLYSSLPEPCRFCAGFYGPNFGEPVCATCHAFVYPRTPDDELEGFCESSSAACKPEDDDSGNDEPDPDAALSTTKQSTYPCQDQQRLVRGCVYGVSCFRNQPVSQVPTAAVLTTPKAIVKKHRKHPNHRRADSLVDQISLLTCPRPMSETSGTYPSLPPEVWAKVFSYLDDLSLWNCGQVCQTWRGMLALDTCESNARWKQRLSGMWPVARSRGGFHKFWWASFGALVESSPCRKCLFQMSEEIRGGHKPQNHDHCYEKDLDAEEGSVRCCSPGQPQHHHHAHHQPQHSLHQHHQYHHPQGSSSAPLAACGGDSSDDLCAETWRSTRLRMEMKILAYESTEGIQAIPLNASKSVWQASVAGPRGSPYEHGTFLLVIKLPRCYPLQPPIVRFLTRVFHPNVSRHGDIGVDCIRHNWTVALSISTVLLSIQSIFTDPYTEVCMEPAIGRLYKENNSLFQSIARFWTRKYASHHIKGMLPGNPFGRASVTSRDASPD
ncbi:unnamed protein product [Notodromas monacha]|uniref:E2 ubiquitin-conjugating enzyme n=1 Tax=Notodromas monacha TaxID=399045 RepID=A0A7R9GCF6_9CRUS|nr:unnamed protein product [Notodromas monacha]CAG0915781.1 unnamed protein product [Notodromas monacha]